MSTQEARGLSEAAAADLLALNGPNELPRPRPPGFPRLVLRALKEPMLQLLTAAGLIYLALGERLEGGLMFASSLLAVTITAVQDLRSERALAALRNLAAPRALVVRDGVRRRVPAREVVVGDLLVLQEGDRVPADAQLDPSAALMIDESLLTGESVAAAKRGDGNAEQSRVLAGTLVLAGEGMATVRAVGAQSAMGSIGASLGGGVLEPPRLQRQTARLVRYAAIVGMAACVVMAGMQMAAGRGLLDSILSALALAIALVPEEIPLIIAVFTVMGAIRISRVGVLARRAAAIETLGETTVLCADKTGTLTWNRMRVAQVWTPAHGVQSAGRADAPGEVRILLATALAAAVTSADPMEAAIADEARFLDLPPISGERLAAYGFDRRALASGCLWGGVDRPTSLAVKGAPESLIRGCAVGKTLQAAVTEAAAAMAATGQRVIAIAEAADAPTDGDLLTAPLRLIGLIGLADPLRETVPAAVAECRSAGVRVVMITGDRPETALAIAAAAGLDVSGGVTTGDELAGLSAEDHSRRARTCNVFARVRPEQKLALVRALKAAGEVVAMTGDGVNDAPALAAADIGVAMGERGSDVAREAAALVLLRDDISSLVATIRLGRRIADNIAKAIVYVLSIHVVIVIAALAPLLAGLPPLLLPLHVVALEFAIDPGCSIVLEGEGEEPGLMRRPPRSAGRGVVTRAAVLWSLLVGAAASTGVVGAYLWSAEHGAAPTDARATAFVVLLAVNVALIELSRHRNIGRRAPAPNPLLWALVAGVAATCAVILLVPPVAKVFGLGTVDWALAGVSLTASAGLAWMVKGARPWIGDPGRPRAKFVHDPC